MRRHFDVIAWVTLSQTPNAAKLQALLLLQVTGEELPPATGMEAAKELLVGSFVGAACAIQSC